MARDHSLHKVAAPLGRRNPSIAVQLVPTVAAAALATASAPVRSLEALASAPRRAARCAVQFHLKR